MEPQYKPGAAWRRPLVAGAGASAVFLGIVGVAEIIGVIPSPLVGGPNPPANNTAPQSHLRAAKCPLCGTVESVRRVESRGVADFAEHSAQGAIVPAGRSEQQAVVPITTGTGAVSQALEEGRGNAENHVAYRVTVRMDDGSYRAISQPSTPTVVVGDRVRVVEGRLVQS